MVSAMHFFGCVVVLAAFGVNYSKACGVAACFGNLDMNDPCSGYRESKSCIEAELPKCSPTLRAAIQQSLDRLDQQCGSSNPCSIANLQSCQSTPVSEDTTMEERCRKIRATRTCLEAILPHCLPEIRGPMERSLALSGDVCPEIAP